MEKEEITEWARRSLAETLERVRRMCIAEYMLLIGELS